MIKIISGFVLCIVLLFTTGCNSTVKVPIVVKEPIQQEVLLEKCTADTPLPTVFVLDKDGKPVYNGKEILRILTEWQKAYDTCAATHDALVDTIRKLQNTESVKIKIKE